MAIKDLFRKREKDAARRSAAAKAPVSTAGGKAPVQAKASADKSATEIKPNIQVAGKTKYHWRKEIIWGPIITEKTRRLAQAHNTVTFKIEPRTGRAEIKEAVEKIFNVKVARVRTELVKRRVRGRTRIRAVRSTYKKAYVTLRPNSKIALFE